MSDAEVGYKDKDWKAADYHKLVLKLADRCFEIVLKETEGFQPQVRWLVFGRVALIIFQHYFGMSFTEAAKAQREGEAAP